MKWDVRFWYFCSCKVSRTHTHTHTHTKLDLVSKVAGMVFLSFYLSWCFAFPYPVFLLLYMS